MGKTFILEQNSEKIRGNLANTLKKTKKYVDIQRSKKKSFQFFEILKSLQDLQDKNKSGQMNTDAVLQQISSRILHFFNTQKQYSTQILNRYIVCLANLLHLLGNRAGNLHFQKDFRLKIKKVATHLIHQKNSDQLTKQIMQAFFYILTVLIHQQKINKTSLLCRVNKSIFQNKELLKLLLSVGLIKDKKISKFYGYIMIQVIKLNHSRKMKELITKGALLNLSSIEHQITFFNLIAFLRNQRNRTKINFQDVMDGNIIEVLLESFAKYRDQQKSQNILSYLIHILQLFPAASSTIAQVSKIINLFALPIGFRPHQYKIVTIIDLFIKYSSFELKNEITQAIVTMIKTSKSLIVFKLAHIFTENHCREDQLIELAQIGYFTDILQGMNMQSEMGTLNEIKNFKLLSLKLRKINSSIGQYLNYQLTSKLRVMKERVPKEWHIFHDHIDQYMI